MRATVVIPTYNRAPYLRRVLTALEREDARGAFDVFVVDDGSTDDTPAVLAADYAFPLRSERQPNAGPALARNRAIGASDADLIVFIDDDVIPAPDLVRTHLDAHAAHADTVVFGRLARPDRAPQPLWAEWETRTLEKHYEAMTSGRWLATPRQFYTANASVQRRHLLEAGLFDPAFRRAEDVELAYRLADLGLRFRFEPAATVVHDTPRTLSAWMDVATQYGHYDIEMFRRGRGHIMWQMAREYRWWRRKSQRRLARRIVGRPTAMAPFRIAMSAAIRAIDITGPRRAGLGLCSAAFNMLYWDAAARALGGRRQFWAEIDFELARDTGEYAPRDPDARPTDARAAAP